MRALKIANATALLLAAGFGIYYVAAPFAAAHWWRSEYKDLMFKCDQVMREHYIAKAAVEINPTEETVKDLEAAELGLLDCHSYDKLRKKLIAWGVTGNELSEIGLEAMEEKKFQLRTFVEIHEIRY
jgi:hypothetical protein